MVENVLVPLCNLCKSPENPGSRCSGCRIVRYCSQEHQLGDWPTHKLKCNTVKRCRTKLEKEETKLRNSPGDLFTPANPFDDPGSVGHFWGILNTRDYMRARVNYVIESLKIDSNDAVAGALEHLRDMLRLCRGDNLGVRDMIPNLYLRLNRDQECYDFIKWYATEGNRGDYDWGNMSLPYLNLENEDVMESVDIFKDGWSVSHGIPITLIKLRMLLDLRDVQASSALLGIDKLNFDAIEHIRGHLALRSSIWSARPALLSYDGLQSRIAVLEKQVDEMYVAMQGGNKLVWEAILRPAAYRDMSPGSYSHGSLEETVILLLNNGKSWAETDGALDWIKGKLEASGSRR